MMNELKPIFGKVKSYYGKAYIEEVYNDDNVSKYLVSYDTRVAYADKNGVPHLLPTFNYSNTTLRHTREFIQQLGYEVFPAKKLWKTYGNLHIE